MKKRIATAVLAVVMSATMIPTAMPVMAQEVTIQSDLDGEQSQTSLQGNAKIVGDKSNGISDKEYNSSGYTPTFTVVLNNGTELTSDTDYTYAWKDSSGKDVSTPLTEVGTYTLTVTGKGSYKGSISTTFKINKATPVISRSDGTTDKNLSKNYDGVEYHYPYQVKVGNRTIANDDPNLKTTYTLTGSSVKNPTSIQEPDTYSIKITCEPRSDADKKHYNSASVYTDTYTINKANLSSLYLVLDKSKFTNDGTKHTPTYHLYSDSAHQHEVTFNSDEITTSPKDVVSKGSYTFTVSATAKNTHYKGSVSAGFTVEDNDGKSGIAFNDTNIAIDDIKDQTYTGNAINPALKVYYKHNVNGKEQKDLLKLGTDYSVEYSNNTEIGDKTAVAKVTGMGKFNSDTPMMKNFSIVGKPVSELNISFNKTSYVYNSQPQEPDITVKNGSKTLVKGTDYQITYPSGETHTNAGNVNFYVEGKTSYYTGKVLKSFTISPHPLKDNELTLDPGSVTVTRPDNSSSISPQTTTVKFTYDRYWDNVNVTSIDGIAVSYSNNTKAGNATVTITGSGNFSGTVRKTFSIIANNANAKDISAGTLGAISDIADQTYTGSQIKPGVTVKYNGVALRSGTDYTVSYGTNTAVGTGSVIVTGINDYKGTITKSFKINPTSIANASISLSNAEYTGGSTTPAVTATFAGNKLREGTDYRVDYSNNVNKGTGTAKFTGLGNFTGTTTKTFSIVDKKDADKKIYATSFTLPSILTVSNGSSVRVTATFTPTDANASSIRWSTSNASFPFSDGFTAKTTEGENGVDVKANAEGSTVITAELFDENSKSLGKQYTLVRTVKSFSDVANDYSTNAINTLANYGYTTGSGETQEFHSTPVINGTSSSTFTPTGDVKRADFVLMLYNKAVADFQKNGGTDPSKAAAAGFTDVASDAYYASAINWAVANGIAEGKGNNNFDPNGTVTRAEAVTFLQRYLKGSNAATNKFSDVSSGAYYAGAVGWAVNNGVTDGTSATTFSPNVKCNRAQAATFIYRAAF